MKKCKRNKAFLGALVGTVGSIAGAAMQKKAQEKQIREQNKNNRNQSAINFSNSYSDDEYTDDFLNKVTFRYGGNKNMNNIMSCGGKTKAEFGIYDRISAYRKRITKDAQKRAETKKRLSARNTKPFPINSPFVKDYTKQTVNNTNKQSSVVSRTISNTNKQNNTTNRVTPPITNKKTVPKTNNTNTNKQSSISTKSRATVNSGTNKLTFSKAFANARRAGKKTFNWNGKSYTTKLASEVNKSKERTINTYSLNTKAIDTRIENTINRTVPSSNVIPNSSSFNISAPTYYDRIDKLKCGGKRKK